MKRLFFLLIFILGTQPLCAETNPQAELDLILTGLQERMSLVKTIQTDFVQEKTLSLFNQKVHLKGKIFIQKPGMLAWKVSSPMRYALVINGTDISQWDQDTDQIQSVALARNPSFQVAIQQMQNWFSGSYKSMQGEYYINLISQQPLTLEFIPQEKSAARNFIHKVTVIFQADQEYINEISILEKNGDSTLLKFIDAKLNQEIPAKAWEVKS